MVVVFEIVQVSAAGVIFLGQYFCDFLDVLMF